MRWGIRKHRCGDVRERAAFLIFPKRVGGEWRWLERAKWSEHYEVGVYAPYQGWYADKWLDAA